MTISTWTPLRQTIANITQANPGVVTTDDDHGYYDGLFVRFQFFSDCGMDQLNDNQYLIEVLSDTTFSIDVNTSSFDAFTLVNSSQSPQCIPVGELATTLANVERNTLIPTGGLP